MIDDSYLKYLAQANSIEEFMLKYTIASGNDISGNIEEYEADYCNRIKSNPIYATEFIKDGKVSFEDVISSKLPIFLSYGKITDETTFCCNAVTKVYDRNAKVQEIKWNLDLAIDMQAMHGIDIETEMQMATRYELERIK